MSRRPSLTVVTDRVLLEVVPFSTIDDANNFNTALSGRLRKIGPAFDRYLEGDRKKTFGTTKADAEARFAACLAEGACGCCGSEEGLLVLCDGCETGAAHPACVSPPLARGAGPNVCDEEGHSPLYHAGYQKRMGNVIRKAGGFRSNIET